MVHPHPRDDLGADRQSLLLLGETVQELDLLSRPGHGYTSLGDTALILGYQ